MEKPLAFDPRKRFYFDPIRALAGGVIFISSYLPAFIFLLGFGLVVIILSIILKQRFDKHTKYFDEKLEESNLFN